MGFRLVLYIGPHVLKSGLRLIMKNSSQQITIKSMAYIKEDISPKNGPHPWIRPSGALMYAVDGRIAATEQNATSALCIRH